MAVYRHRFDIHFQAAVMQLPVCHVIVGVAKNFGVLDESGNEINPFLVHEDALLKLNQTMVINLALPPKEKLTVAWPILQAEKSQVVVARLKNFQVSRARTVLVGRRDMGCNDDGILPQQIRKRIQAAGNEDVRIEIDQFPNLMFLEQVSEQVRLDRRTGL